MSEFEQLQHLMPGYRFVKSVTEYNQETETVTVTIEYSKNHVGLIAQLKRNKQIPEVETNA